MKQNRVIFIVSTLIISLALATNVSAASSTDKTLENSSARLTWSEPWYVDKVCTYHDLNYQNNSGAQLLGLEYSIRDSLGHEIRSDSEIGLVSGAKGTWNVQICGNTIPLMLTEGLGPYTLRLKVKTFMNGTSQVETPLTFTLAPTAVPTPTPTVTVTATPNPNSTMNLKALQKQVRDLQSKLTKICNAKPKPKYC